jgi:TonB family protein
LLASNIVPPPPSLGGGSAATGSGLGRKGTGLGAPLDAGASLAPPKTSGSGANAGAVLSSDPGPKLGLPSTSTGSLAMSPAGGDKVGLGGAGGGTSIGRGTGPGSGLNGAGTGAGKTGAEHTSAEHGSDPGARGGISPAPGPGGAGNVSAGAPAVRGVDISGGSSQVTIPAFGAEGSPSDPQLPGHTSVKHSKTFDVDIVATASSGGAFEPYKNLLHGEKHTIYPETSSSLGTAAMEYAESAAGHGAFTPPQSIRTNLPEGLPHARLVVTCVLDASGNLKGIRVLEAGPADMTAKVLAALRSWKFEPAMRGEQPVEVTAILGFGVDTNDRF